ncbi:MAG TPA: DUF4450 domain-containing protein [Chitinophagaceae bacterium]
MRLNACKLFCVLCVLACGYLSHAQDSEVELWHNKERTVRYRPDGTDFVITNGDRRFNRALYGTNTGFRVEAGDLPEFALYLPGMGGNLKFGLIKGQESEWIIKAKKIEARYRPGSMIYIIEDPMLSKGKLLVTVLAMHDREGVIIKVEGRNIPKNLKLFTAYGGATGSRFSRDGDIGADPESSFDLKREYCKGNVFKFDRNTFSLGFGPNNSPRTIRGIFPLTASCKLGDATEQDNPVSLLYSDTADAPVVTAQMPLNATALYFVIINANAQPLPAYSELPSLFEKAEAARKKLAERVKLVTPDIHLNTLGGALAIAADAIWEDPTYLHGAVAWRMRLNAWRGAYVADPLGWHDRARKHFSSYALSQVTTPPETGVVMDTALHLSRHLEKIGTALFSDGYICRNPNGDIRAHHYDMNLVFVDQLLNHFNWTGDTTYVREMWPLIKRHLAWEKRNFDADGDGLYDAYAAIWASDALQYSGGGVTHSSAYNYRANKTAAWLATLIGENGAAYEAEANKIFKAIQDYLWLTSEGSYAEYKDLLGKKMVHRSAGIWTIYHAIDSKVPDPFQAFQSLRYVDGEIPHIPVIADGWRKNQYVLSTTSWQPYTWSINNVALAENLHMALAYWQGNRSEEAFQLWESTLLESMYLGASPGGFQQLSFYDAMRGELYRDFADGLGMTARSLVEGLFGIQPDAMNGTLHIQPGLPSQWNFASLQVPDIHIDFKRNGNIDRYGIKQFFRKQMKLQLSLSARMDNIAKLIVNGKSVRWKVVESPVSKPMLVIDVPAAAEYDVQIHWSGNKIASLQYPKEIATDTIFTITSSPHIRMLDINDPQSLFNAKDSGQSTYSFDIKSRRLGDRTFFVRVKQGVFTWWQPVCFYLIAGSNIPIDVGGTIYGYQKVPIDKYFNDKVTNIFKQQYLSPRPTSPTLQLPTQGIGNWCYPLVTANISDSGLRVNAGLKNEIRSMRGIPFATPSDTSLNNIIYTSQWDNYPDSVTIPLEGNASVAELLMAGSTNPMQFDVTNGMVTVQYTDGSGDTLVLWNPINWWPIEQDYYNDRFAFDVGAQRERLYLKDGKFAKGLTSYTSIRGFTNRAIDGGAANLEYLNLDKNKTLQSLTVHAIANDVVIGLMAVTLGK